MHFGDDIRTTYLNPYSLPMAKFLRGVVDFNQLPEEVVEQVIFFLAPSRPRSGSLYSSARISIMQQHKAQLLAQLQQIQALGKVSSAFKRSLLKLPFDVRVMFRLDVPFVDTIVFKFHIHEEILSLFYWSAKVQTLQVESAPKSELVGQALAFMVYAGDRRVFFDIVDIPVPAFSNIRSLPPCDSNELLAQGIGTLDLVGLSPIAGNLVCLDVALKPGKLLYFVSEAFFWCGWNKHREFARQAEFDLCSKNKFVAESNKRWDDNWFFLLLVPLEFIVAMKAANYIVTEEVRFGGSYKCDLTGLSEFPDIEPTKIGLAVCYC
jgi:hypothetical protein